MIGHRIIASSLAMPLAAAVAWADAPPAPLAAVRVICAGTVRDGACATIDTRAGRTTVRRRSARQTQSWSMASAPLFASLSPDGRFLVEEHRAGGLIEPADDAATPILTFRDRGRIVRSVKLGEIVVPDGLPRTASHRVWSTIRYFPDAMHFRVFLPNGTAVLFDLANGRMTRGPASLTRR